MWRKNSRQDNRDRRDSRDYEEFRRDSRDSVILDLEHVSVNLSFVLGIQRRELLGFALSSLQSVTFDPLS